MSATASTASSILVVAAQREDRRALFDALDGHGFAAIYAARDVLQARALLAEQPRVDLVMLEMVGEAREAVAFCTQLHGMNDYRQVPILGILATDPAQRIWSHQRSPPGVVEWVHTPVDADEVLARVQAALSRGDVPGQAVARGARGGSGDYRFAFDGSDDEWIISDPHDGGVLEINPAFERRSGLGIATVRGRALDYLLGGISQDRARQRVALERDGIVERVVQRVRADGGHDSMRAITRLAVRDGRVVHATSLRGHSEADHSRAMLDLLSRLHTAGSGDEGVRAAAGMLAKALKLDYLAVYAAFPESNGEPLLLAQELREPVGSEIPDPQQQPTLQLVLDGESLMHPADARRLAESDQFVQAMGFNAFAGLPLADERHNVLGALLAGNREGWDQRLLLPETLRAAASRFAFELELRRARQQGRAKGLLDGLTNLPNRLLFNDRLETTLREARRTGEMFAVLFVDLDRFKSINDSLGHSTGDEVLLAVAKRLRASVRSSDTVARYAGDEYTVILRHITQRDDVLRIAEKIVRLMEAPLMLADGSELHITASIGVSFYPDDAATAERLLKHADVAMYNAKGQGRNGYQVYVAVPEESHQQRMALESKLRQAEKNGELRVHYQPQVDALSEDIVGMEALVRWEHPELGMISPGFFIPLAEETGLIISLGEWVLRTACDDAARWRSRYGLPLRIGVNLSALQLMQPNLPDVVTSALHNSGLDPGSLEFEVTESISVKSIPHLFENLQALHDIGCRLAIDDFGTGQSSLDYLKKLPAERIKIDQSFVRNIGVDPDDEAIVKATIGMAHSLNRAVVAEGVEIEAHLKFLRAHQCDELQGYLFCRPLAHNAFDNLLAERQRLAGRFDGEGSAA